MYREVVQLSSRRVPDYQKLERRLAEMERKQKRSRSPRRGGAAGRHQSKNQQAIAWTTAGNQPAIAAPPQQQKGDKGKGRNKKKNDKGKGKGGGNGKASQTFRSFADIVKLGRQGRNLLHPGAGETGDCFNFQMHQPCKDTPCVRSHACAGCGTRTNLTMIAFASTSRPEHLLPR